MSLFKANNVSNFINQEHCKITTMSIFILFIYVIYVTNHQNHCKCKMQMSVILWFNKKKHKKNYTYKSNIKMIYFQNFPENKEARISNLKLRYPMVQIISGFGIAFYSL